MKKYAFIFLALLSFAFLKGQSIVDTVYANPDPFPNRTLIKYSHIQNDTVSIKIYANISSVMTPIINLIIDSVMPPGQYNDSLIMDQYVDATYYVELKLGHRKSLFKTIVKANVSGIQTIPERLKNFNIYPNPTTGKINVEKV